MMNTLNFHLRGSANRDKLSLEKMMDHEKEEAVKVKSLLY